MATLILLGAVFGLVAGFVMGWIGGRVYGQQEGRAGAVRDGYAAARRDLVPVPPLPTQPALSVATPPVAATPAGPIVLVVQNQGPALDGAAAVPAAAYSQIDELAMQLAAAERARNRTAAHAAIAGHMVPAIDGNDQGPRR